MDLFTANTAQSLHAHESRRLTQDLEHIRVARERAAENAVGRADVSSTTRRRTFSLSAIFRGRARTAQ